MDKKYQPNYKTLEADLSKLRRPFQLEVVLHPEKIQQMVSS